MKTHHYDDDVNDVLVNNETMSQSMRDIQNIQEHHIDAPVPKKQRVEEPMQIISLLDDESDDDDVAHIVNRPTKRDSWPKLLVSTKFEADSCVKISEREMAKMISSGFRIEVSAQRSDIISKNVRKIECPRVRLSFNTLSELNTFGRFPKDLGDLIHPLLLANVIRVDVYCQFAFPSQLHPFAKVPLEMHVYVTNTDIFDEFQSWEDNPSPLATAFVRLVNKLVDDEPEPDWENSQDSQNSEPISEETKQQIMEYDCELQEEADPPGLLINLRPHQRIALSWMLKMENSPVEQSNPWWRTHRFKDGTIFSSNKYTGKVVLGAPPPLHPLRGGILGDEMGMGKTICVLALILSEIEQPAFQANDQDEEGAADDQEGDVNLQEDIAPKYQTLVACPTSLVAQWESELTTKTDPPLRVLVFHGQDRHKHDLCKYDCVITSYGTLASESEKSNSQLFEIHWRRFVLDEAHLIRNRNTCNAKSVKKIIADRRWCLSGTPLQNSINDIFSLIDFLKFEPWSHYAFWQKVIGKPFLNPDTTGNAVKRLRKLLADGPLLLRRTKAEHMKEDPLPIKTIECFNFDMSSCEREFYDSLLNKSKQEFNGIVASGSFGKKYTEIFTLLLRLRQTCDHPFLVLSADGQATSTILAQIHLLKNQTSTEESKSFLANTLKNFSSEKSTQEYLDNSECPVCLDTLQNAIITKCGHTVCHRCMINWSHDRRVDDIFPCPVCRNELNFSTDMAHVNQASQIYQDAKREEPSTSSSPPPSSQPCTSDANASMKGINEKMLSDYWVASSKIAKIFDIIDEIATINGQIEKNLPISDEVKQKYFGDDTELAPIKIVLFSQWTKMIAMLEHECKIRKHQFCSLVGSMSVNKRAQSIKKFNDDPLSNVFVVSLQAGCLGLNLTCASVAIVVDPWWNPAVEIQAIDRIHRIGQRRPVHVYRMITRDSVEEKLLQLQVKKSRLAQEALDNISSKRASNEKLSLEDFVELFS